MRFRSCSRMLCVVAVSASSFAPVRWLVAQTVTLNGTELQVNVGAGVGAPIMDGPRLKMTDGEYGTARSALSTGTFNLFNAWSTSFRLSFSCDGVPPNTTLTDEFNQPLPPEVICPGDGIAFVATSGAAGQVGNAGFGLGYETPGASSDFANSLAFGMKTFWQFADLGVDGVWTRDCCSGDKLFPNGSDFLDDFDVQLSYDGLNALSASIRRVSSGTTVFTESYAWTAPLWSQQARVGFTSASGLAAEQSWVSDWQLRTTTTVPEPSTLALTAAGLVLAIAVGRRRAV